jgi:phosphatidylinositol alpha-mannosyltransferase
MKICMVSDTYYPYVGGIPEHIFHLSNTLRQRGHSVQILTSKFNGKVLNTTSLPSDEEFIYRIGRGVMIRANKSFAQLPIGWRLSDKIEKFFQKEKFDIVHIHGSLAPTLPILALRHSKSVNVMTYHAGHPKDIKYLLFHQILLPYLRKLDGRIAVSEAACDSNLHFYPSECVIIPNAIDTGLFNPSIPRLPQFNDNRPKILFLGRFEPRKGLKYLLQALPIIKKQIPDVLLIVVGEGILGYAYQEYIAKEVKNNIHFAGLITGKARAEYYASCDVFCAPSIGNESFGIILLESMATAKPVVASDIPGYNAVVDDGIDGFLAAPRVPHEIADRLIKILSNPRLARTMGDAGRRKSLTYSWEKIAQQIEDYYHVLLQRHN